MSGLLKKHLDEKKFTKRSSKPAWSGPESDADDGGITFSLLSRWLVCKERFRLMTIEGLQAPDRFSAPLEYGNMWHACEEALAAEEDWHVKLQAYSGDLLTKYPFDQEQVLHWHQMCETIFPKYAEHWALHPDVQNRTPLLQEQVFKVPYRLPSGRTVFLRGKWDSVDLVEEPPVGIYIQENKTKSTIDRAKIERQLRMDMQTMLYLIAHIAEDANHDPNGVRYNVVRRPAHKSTESALKKLEEDRRAGRIEEWFLRRRVEVLKSDVERFLGICLIPILENVCDDYEWWNWCRSPFEFPHPSVLRSYCKEAAKSPDLWSGTQRGRLFPHHWPRHFVFPHGVYNPLIEHGATEYDTCIETGSRTGLTKVKTLFPELGV